VTVKKTALFSCVALDFSAVLIAICVLLIEALVCTLSCHNSSSLCPVLFLVVWVGSWVQIFHLRWVGLGQSFGGLGWAGTKKMDPRTTLTARAVNYAYRYWKSVCLPT